MNEAYATIGAKRYFAQMVKVSDKAYVDPDGYKMGQIYGGYTGQLVCNNGTYTVIGGIVV